MSTNGRPNSLLHNRYQIIRPLEAAYGNFEKAFIVEDKLAPESLCPRYIIRQLKLNTIDRLAHQAISEKFQAEANTLVKLEHPQLPKFYDYFEEGGYFYIVQEAIEGRSLRRRISETQPLSSRNVEEILLSLLPILEHLHRHRIIHRDIRPGNIILSQQNCQLVLTNFGIIEQSLKAVMNLPEEGSSSPLISSLGFVAPEQKVNRATYSSDLYSLGITAVYLLTGKLPDDIEKDPQTNQLFWQKHTSDVAPHLAAVLNRAIQFDPNNRYDTANDMLQALKLHSAKGLATTTIRDFSNSEPESSGLTLTPLSSPNNITPTNQAKADELIQATSPKPGGRSRGLTSFGAAVLLVSGVSIAYIHRQAGSTRASKINTPVLEKEVAPIPSPEDLELSASDSLRKAQILQSQGQYPAAIAAALEVLPTSSVAVQAQQLVAELTHIPVDGVLDEALPPQNVEARKIKFLEGTIENPQKPVITRFGESRINANKVAWKKYQTPEGPLQGGQHFLENWDDPWMETYDIVPGKFRLGVIYGCRINAVLQTEAYFHPDVDIGFMKAKLNQMIEGTASLQSEEKLEQIYTGEINQYTFQNNGYLGLIQRTDAGEILIAVREV